MTEREQVKEIVNNNALLSEYEVGKQQAVHNGFSPFGPHKC